MKKTILLSTIILSFLSCSLNHTEYKTTGSDYSIIDTLSNGDLIIEIDNQLYKQIKVGDTFYREHYYQL